MKLYPFQQRVFDAVMAGQSVILQAPTGAGKTRAALTPFYTNLARDGHDLPQTCRYAVPLRTLANQFYEQGRAQIQGLDRHTGQHISRSYARFGGAVVQIQTGDQPGDRFFESALTFCTIDQVLASFLAIPYGTGTRMANLSPAAIFGSYLIFDEFHLFPYGDRNGRGARTTTLKMLQLLRRPKARLTPFVLMTATFSQELLGELSAMLDATIITIDDPDELAVLNAGRSRLFTIHDAPLNPAAILAVHQDCSLVVCNTVLRAQQAALALEADIRASGADIRVKLLHSRFTDSDRQQQQHELEQELGPAAWNGATYLGPNLIVVATQVVEVGLDISVRMLHSEVAPANSIIQRAGRCARFAGQQGTVHLYPLTADDQGKTSYLPYDEPQTVATMEAFAAAQGRSLNFRDEQDIIDHVHTVEDRRMLELFRTQQGEIECQIFRGFANHDRGIVTDLIRDVQQVSVLIHADPNAAITRRPWEWEMFGLRPYALQASLGRFREGQQPDELGIERPVVWEAVLLDEESEENERREPRYQWIPLANPARIPLALMLCLDPAFAAYDATLGLVLNDGRLLTEWPATTTPSAQIRRKGPRGGHAAHYEQESYIEHITGLLAAYESQLAAGIRYVAARLEQAMGLPTGAVDQAIRIAIACHDLGKLGTGWQRWALQWQGLLATTYPAHAETFASHKYPFAHTDFDSDNDEHRRLQRTIKPPRPNHACESAWLALPIIEASFADCGISELAGPALARATAAAIARHHSATSTNYEAIALIPDAHSYLNEALQLTRRSLPWTFDRGALEAAIDHKAALDPKTDMTTPNTNALGETLLYFLIARTLRLADQRSFAYRNT